MSTTLKKLAVPSASCGLHLGAGLRRRRPFFFPLGPPSVWSIGFSGIGTSRIFAAPPIICIALGGGRESSALEALKSGGRARAGGQGEDEGKWVTVGHGLGTCLLDPASL
jgi:hypothetical protein